MPAIGRFIPRVLKGQIRAASARLGWHGRPEFLIIGAQKAGTSALHRYLAGHPDLSASLLKELYFFCPEALRGWTDHPDNARFARFERQDHDPLVRLEALRWYHAQFRMPWPGRQKRFFDTTPCYLFFPDAARRIHAYRPEMKLVVLLRDPVERAYSAWTMFRCFCEPPYGQLRDERSFEEAVREEIERLPHDPPGVGSDYVRRGIYHEQLRHYLDLFPREQILIVDNRELKSRRWETLNTVCRFLDVEPFAKEESWHPVLVGSYSDEMPASVQEFPTNFYAPHNAALFALTGRKFDWGEQREEPAFETFPRPISRVA